MTNFFKIKGTETFAGTERHKAFAYFERVKKQHPNITVEQNTGKEKWEK